MIDLPQARSRPRGCASSSGSVARRYWTCSPHGGVACVWHRWGRRVGQNRSLRAQLDAARSQLEHRGPDGGGTWVNPRRTAGLVHTRLAIVDLAGGKQPIANEHENVQVVFNGEIYNHIELRADLET